jgi:hypothetical protein
MAIPLTHGMHRSLTLALVAVVLLWLAFARARPAQAAPQVMVVNCTAQGLADAMNSLNGTSGGTIGFNGSNVSATSRPRSCSL